jgi:hypothetical protein
MVTDAAAGGTDIGPAGQLADRSQAAMSALRQLHAMPILPPIADTQTRAFTQFVYGDHAATLSISVGSSLGARELFTRRDTGHVCK